MALKKKKMREKSDEIGSCGKREITTKIYKKKKKGRGICRQWRRECKGKRVRKSNISRD